MSFNLIFLIQVLEHSEYIIDLIRVLFFLSATMVHLFFISWQGQRISDFTEDLLKSM